MQKLSNDGMERLLMFDLYFAATQGKNSIQYRVDFNSNILLSWILDRKSIDYLVELKRSKKYNGKLFIDSGAFTAHRKDTIIDTDKYIDFLNERDDVLDLYAQVDSIPGKFGQVRTKEDIKIATKLSKDNYLYMVNKVKSSEKLLPVFHQDESFSHLDWMLNLKVNNNLIPYIGISGAKDRSVELRFNWYLEVFEHIYNSNNPKVKTHAFGTSSINHLVQYPFTSSDSTSWLQTAANGGVICKYGVIKLSDRTLSDPDNIFNSPALEKFSLYTKDLGYNIEDLKTDYELRSKFNIEFLDTWSKNYKYKGLKNFKRSKLF